MAGLTVDIVTPEKVAFSGPADEVIAPGVQGEFGVLPSHALLLTLLRPGVVTIKAGASSTRFVVGPGFAETRPDKIVLLVDACETASSVDKAAAAKELSAALELMARSSSGELDRITAERTAALSQARIDV